MRDENRESVTDWEPRGDRWRIVISPRVEGGVGGEKGDTKGACFISLCVSMTVEKERERESARATDNTRLHRVITIA